MDYDSYDTHILYTYTHTIRVCVFARACVCDRISVTKLVKLKSFLISKTQLTLLGQSGVDNEVDELSFFCSSLLSPA